METNLRADGGAAAFFAVSFIHQSFACRSVSVITLGYVDENEAKIVREIFERYAAGEMVADIIRDLNARKITTSLGKEFNKNSMHRLLRNRRYIGMYIYKGEETPGGMPQIVDNDLFDRVQSILDKNKAAPARSRGKQEYLLTTKLFCGHCKEMMTGYKVPVKIK